MQRDVVSWNMNEVKGLAFLPAPRLGPKMGQEVEEGSGIWEVGKCEFSGSNQWKHYYRLIRPKLRLWAMNEILVGSDHLRLVGGSGILLQVCHPRWIIVLVRGRVMHYDVASWIWNDERGRTSLLWNFSHKTQMGLELLSFLQKGNIRSLSM